MITINNTLDGYLKDVEIKGNTIQDPSNLEDIRSVGDKVEGQELYEIPVLSCGKNLNSSSIKRGNINANTGIEESGANTILCTENFIPAKPETIYAISSNISIGSILLMCYNENKEYLGYCNISNGSFKTKLGTKYVKFRFWKLSSAEFTDLEVSTIKVQLEEGTVSTPYEPYQEDKLTILSPVQLEKVGDVRDRIICKDGVWGVEKNVNTVVLDESMAYSDVSDSFPSDNSCMFAFATSDIVLDTIILCDKFPNVNISNENNRNIEGIFTSVYSDSYAFYFRIFNDKLPTQNIPGLRQWLSKNNITIKYKTSQPQFIPLPHDQQIKLRTFANKTNISFLTEIEGTIKAQVPKSLGATVNTHTEQIRSLNNELNRVKKLEESTVSTVTTESDFTTVEATSNGYFEDVKLEGKTLVNLSTLKDKTLSNSSNDGRRLDFNASMFKAGTDYTLIMNVGNVANATRSLFIQWDFIDDSASKFNTISNVSSLTNSTVVFKFRQDVLPSKLKRVYLSLHIDDSTSCTCEIKDCIVLEGDHTQNPPSYFEGLKSVGQDVDEIVVSSVKGDGNLFDDTCISLNKFLTPEGNLTNIDGWFVSDYIKITGDCYIQGLINIASSGLSRICVYDKNKKFKRLLTQPLNTILNISQYVENNDYIRITEKIEQAKNVIVCKTTLLNSQHQSDKKRLLYYNNETQTWKKPILRQWDSIEKHANGKYYYHQRSGEVVLNGSENWNLNTQTQSESVIRFNLDATSIGMAGNRNPVISDKFRLTTNYDITSNEESIFTSMGGATLFITISKSKLSTQDMQGFKQWLQTNNVTVVYQLAQEKVYECTNIDLITYANETNYLVESGPIVPKSILKVHNNISNVVSLLQKKVSLLESDITSYMITQNRLMLASRYNADTVSFKVDYSEAYSAENVIDEDLFNLLYNVIIVGKDNYDYDKMLEMMDFYVFEGFISWEMWDYLYAIIDLQHNPPIIEEEIEDSIE